MTEAAKKTRAPRKAPAKTVAQQQMEAFKGPNGKASAVAFFHNSLPRLVTHYDHGEEVYALIRRWNGLKTEAEENGEVSFKDLGEIVPDLKRFVDLVYVENAREFITLHFNGNLLDFFLCTN